MAGASKPLAVTRTSCKPFAPGTEQGGVAGHPLAVHEDVEVAHRAPVGSLASTTMAPGAGLRTNATSAVDDGRRQRPGDTPGRDHAWDRDTRNPPGGVLPREGRREIQRRERRRSERRGRSCRSPPGARHDDRQLGKPPEGRPGSSRVDSSSGIASFLKTSVAGSAKTSRDVVLLLVLVVASLAHGALARAVRGGTERLHLACPATRRECL